MNVSKVRRSIGVTIVLAHRYELCFTLIGAIHAAALRVTIQYSSHEYCSDRTLKVTYSSTNAACPGRVT